MRLIKRASVVRANVTIMGRTPPTTAALRLVATVLILTVAAGCAATPKPKEDILERRRPNVIVILADDLGYGEVGCYGQEKIRTPNIDALAAGGMRLHAAYSGAPVCAPSRNVLLTGRHLGHVTIRGNMEASRGATRLERLVAEGSPFARGLHLGENREGQMPIPDGAYTLAEAFQDAGYATGAFGKWGLGPVASSGDPQSQGFDHFYGYMCQAQAHSYFPGHLWDDGRRVEINVKSIPGHAKAPTGPIRAEDWRAENYAPDLILKRGLEFIRRHEARPFFLYLPFVEPHVAMQPPQRLVDAYPEDWDTEPYRGESGYTPHPRPRAGYAAMISGLDEHVGKITALLRDLDLERDTIVLFTSDNGTTHRSGSNRFGVGGVDADFFASTAGLRGFKGSVYEGGLRVPFIVRWPGHVAPGGRSDVPSYFPDVMPTLLAACGIAPPDGLDGVSLLDLLEGRASALGRPPMIWVFAEYGGQVAVRMDEWKLVRQGLLRPAGPSPWELYDLAVDPAEMHDLAAARPDIVERGAAILRAQCDDNPLFPVHLPE